MNTGRWISGGIGAIGWVRRRPRGRRNRTPAGWNEYLSGGKAADGEVDHIATFPGISFGRDCFAIGGKIAPLWNDNKLHISLYDCPGSGRSTVNMK